jgi:arabinogalactan endo-1,4-beta-galactosidase
MIGLSHYPMMSEWSGIPWEEANRRAEENIRALIRTFHRPVMIAEVGMMNRGEGAVYDSVAALSDTVMTDFLARIAPIDSCVGVFYWEPQVYGGWKPAEYAPLGWGGYDMGSFTPEGKPSPALKTLLGAHGHRLE